ncbi:hypothetical protein D1007_49715 [Hordeum vulgare]|nr:hypothetical protein D1007_49715 [Hordeum vulgare]
MTFFLREDDPISIGHAVAHAMATQKVEIAEFTVFTERDKTYCDDDDLVNYGRQFMLFFDACSNAFGGLTGHSTMLQVEHTQLIELAIVDCSFERVELSSLPKLTRIIFEGWISFRDPLSFGYVPLLDVVSLTTVGLSWHKMARLSKFLQGTTSVRQLQLGFKSERFGFNQNV